MSDIEIILRLSTAALLVGILGCIFARWQWDHACKRKYPRHQFKLNGNPIDISPLRPRMEAVRRDFAKAAQAHARSISAREALVTAARCKLSQLPFFVQHPAEPEAERHVA